jgi:hypothetical protein
MTKAWRKGSRRDLCPERSLSSPQRPRSVATEVSALAVSARGAQRNLDTN